MSKALYKTTAVTTITNTYKVFATAVRAAKGARGRGGGARGGAKGGARGGGGGGAR